MTDLTDLHDCHPVRPHFWQVRPCFDFGHHRTCPYIWFAWWLITWETRPFRLHISYMPD